jgi:hypothetical protein
MGILIFTMGFILVAALAAAIVDLILWLQNRGL